MRKVLNVGGNNESFAPPRQCQGWQHILLDIDPGGRPDIVCDVVYGYGVQIEHSNTAATIATRQGGIHAESPRCAAEEMRLCPRELVGAGNLEILAYAFREPPGVVATKLLGIPTAPEA